MLDFCSDRPNFPLRSNGHIQVIFGPMFSGKTTELIRRLKRYQIANHQCLIIKYSHDSRYSDTGIATHDRQILDAVSTTVLSDLRNAAKNYSVIGVDEGQFNTDLLKETILPFSSSFKRGIDALFPDTVSFAEEMANNGKIIIIAALDGTYQRKGFGDIIDLIPLAESVIKLTAVCMLCFEDASYTKRIGSETQVEIIGGTDKYMAVCRSCYELDSSIPIKKAIEPICDISNSSEKENKPC